MGQWVQADAPGMDAAYPPSAAVARRRHPGQKTGLGP